MLNTVIEYNDIHISSGISTFLGRGGDQSRGEVKVKMAGGFCLKLDHSLSFPFLFPRSASTVGSFC